MPSDLLSTIREEIEDRLTELRPLILEYEQLLAFTTAVNGSPAAPPVPHEPPLGASPSRPTRAAPAKRGRPRSPSSSAAGAPSPDPGTPSPAAGSSSPAAGASSPAAGSSSPAPKRSRAVRRPRRGPAASAILAALEHGSHTTAELTVVTGLSAGAVRRDVRVLIDHGAIQRIDRDGKTAYAVP